MHNPMLLVPERNTLERIYRENATRYQATLDGFTARVHELFRGAPFHLTVKTRVKSFESYYQKLLKRLRDPNGSAGNGKIYDLLGMRLVVPFIEDIETVKKVLTAHLDIVEHEEKSRKQSYREFGYRSTHFLVRLPADPDIRFPSAEECVCEIQLHTLLQDAWAEVEHELVYKADFTPLDEALKRKLASLNATLTLSDIIFQELRSYQNRLNEQLDRRRRFFLEQLHPEGRSREPSGESAADGLLLRGSSVAGPAHGRIETRHLMDDGFRNDIDQYLLDALYAHNDGDYTRAIELYGRILALEPPLVVRSIIYVHRSMAYFSCSDVPSALADLDLALAADPENCRALNYRGLIHATGMNDEAALQSFDQSLQLNPFQAEPLIGRARINYKRGRKGDALRDAERAAGLFPDLEEATELLRIIREGARDTG